MGTPKYVAVNMALHFVFAGVAVFWLVSLIGIRRLLGAESSVLINVGTVLGTVACAVMAQMMLIQGSVMSKMGQTYLSVASVSERQSVIALYKGLRFIDYGMDLTFDMFFFTAWILLGISILGHRVFATWLGGVGIVVFVFAAFMNFRTVPDPPAFDFGPFAALWVLAVYIQMLRLAKSLPVLAGEDGVG